VALLPTAAWAALAYQSVTGFGTPTGHRPQYKNTEPEHMARSSKVPVGFGDSEYSAICYRRLLRWLL
jgi:hypothetical protein